MSNWIFAAILIAYGLINVFGAMGAEGQNKRWPLLGSFFGLFLGGVFLFLALSASNHPPQSIPPTATPTQFVAAATDVPTQQPSLTPAPTKAPQPSAVSQVKASALNVGVNVRSGPGTSFNIVSGLVQNDMADVIGRNSDTSWLEIITPKGVKGWVNASVISVTGATNGLPVVTPMPTNTP
ncbi:MAG: SH3 domain-containing protein [Anaerolineaceae bacterium]|nr:SH3 domain-containing protein [Anaerolineaceae bacterium]